MGVEVGLVGVGVAVGLSVEVGDVVTVNVGLALEVTVGSPGVSVGVVVGGGTSPGLVNRKAIRATTRMATTPMGKAYFRSSGICFSLALINVVTSRRFAGIPNRR